MSVRDLQGLYEYGGLIRNTLVHAISAEWGWLGRCGQVALLYRMLGHAPGNFDALFYFAGDIALR